MTSHSDLLWGVGGGGRPGGGRRGELPQFQIIRPL